MDNIFVSSNVLISVFFYLPLTILIYGIARTLLVRLIFSKNQGALRYHTLIDQLWRPQLSYGDWLPRTMTKCGRKSIERIVNKFGNYIIDMV